MPDEEHDYASKKHEQYLQERNGLIDAARESLRTFDKAVLTFGSAVFGASIAFIKDVAPKPRPFTLKWLGSSWLCFSIGLLLVLLSFIWSHKACMFDIEESGNALNDDSYRRKDNTWAKRTDRCNKWCVVFLFLGLVLWAVFAIENLQS